MRTTTRTPAAAAPWRLQCPQISGPATWCIAKNSTKRATAKRRVQSLLLLPLFFGSCRSSSRGRGPNIALHLNVVFSRNCSRSTRAGRVSRGLRLAAGLRVILRMLASQWHEWDGPGWSYITRAGISDLRLASLCGSCPGTRIEHLPESSLKLFPEVFRRRFVARAPCSSGVTSVYPGVK
jgi:hypothetical protein